MLSLLLSLAAALQLPVVVSAEEVQIGEPIQCTVDLSGVEDVTLSPAEVFNPGFSWVLLEAPMIERLDGAKATLSWSLFALEADAGELPTPPLSLAGEPVTLLAPSVTVLAALAEGEDEPRAARGFHPLELDSESSSPGAWPLLVVSSVLALFALYWLRRRPSKELIPVLSLSARLEELRSEVDGDAAALANVHRELAHLLRTAYGDSSHGWSDEEWVERAELSEEQRADLRVVLSTCAEVKYGGARPTRFAVEETLDRVSTLLIEADEVAA